MGGDIRVESKVGAGSTFLFWVKARLAEAPESAPADGGTVPREATPLHILLAEDNPVNQVVATSLLRKHGHTVVVVENGRLAVERAAAESFDLILMDLQMPEMDGWDATRRIREHQQSCGRRVPILALTAHAMSHVERQCRMLGMDSVIVKPFDPVQFYAAVEGTTAVAEPRQ
jgi:CheY-like chemotaxis protein